MIDNLNAKIGLLKLGTTTVECGNHFRKIKNLINKEFAEEELSASIYCNKWLLIKMLELESCWNDDAKQIHRLLHKQLTQNIKSSMQ